MIRKKRKERKEKYVKFYYSTATLKMTQKVLEGQARIDSFEDIMDVLYKCVRTREYKVHAVNARRTYAGEKFKRRVGV